MKKTVLILFTAFALINCIQNKSEKEQQISIETNEPRGVENVAYKWGYMALTA